MTTEITRIIIHYDDGSSMHITTHDLDRIKALQNAVSFIEQAKFVYEALKPYFSKVS